MSRANKDSTYDQIPMPQGYRRLSRGKRLVMELSIGVAILALIPIGVSVQMPHWLQLIGWAVFVVCLVGQSVLTTRWWRRRRAGRLPSVNAAARDDARQ
jgi:hypothetical protein